MRRGCLLAVGCALSPRRLRGLRRAVTAQSSSARPAARARRRRRRRSPAATSTSPCGRATPTPSRRRSRSWRPQFNAIHPHITVTPQFYGNNDYALQKVLAAIAGGKPPDISYLYGSNAANIAGTSKLVPLTDWLNEDTSFGWSHFFGFERTVATVNGKVVGIPALVDNLALVYNKKLFKQAGIPPPTDQLDVERLRAGGAEADRSGQEAVRLGVRQRRLRGHGVALLGDAVAGGRLDPQPRRQAGGVQLGRRRSRR